jgi:predicted TIM-barrel fold metal-dependent hydrolase
MQRRQTALTAGCRVVFAVCLLLCLAPLLALGDAHNAAVRAEHHAHIRSEMMAELLAEQAVDGEARPAASAEAATAADLLVAMDGAGIDRAVVISVAYRLGAPGFGPPDEAALVRAENDYVAAETGIAPERLAAICSVNPLKAYALDEIRRCASAVRVAGMKFHFTNSGVDLRDAGHVTALQEAFRTLASLELPVVVHLRTQRDDYGAEDARIFIDDVLRVAPGLPVQVAHMAGWGGYDTATDAALGEFAAAFEDGRLGEDAVSFDLAAVVFDPDAAGDNVELAETVRAANSRLAARIRSIGPDRVLFATDWPVWPPTPDPRLKLAQNLRLLHKALPLDEAEWAAIHSKENLAFFEGRDR